MSSTGTVGPVFNIDTAALAHHYRYYYNSLASDPWFLAFCLLLVCCFVPGCLFWSAVYRFRRLNTVHTPGALRPADIEAQVLLGGHGRHAR